jgi:HEAT repeat protein
MGTRSGKLRSARSVRITTKQGEGAMSHIGEMAMLFLLIASSSFSVSAQSIDQLAGAVQNGSTEEKRSALFELRNRRSEQASRAALPALKDRDEIVRATAVSSVVFLPKIEASTQLLPLLKDPSEFVRKETAYALGNVGDAPAMHGEEIDGTVGLALWQMLDKEKSLEVKSAAIIALGKCGGLRSVERLTFYLEKPAKEETDFLRRSAVRGIGTIAEDFRSGSRIFYSSSRGYTPEEIRDIDLSEDFRWFSFAANTLIKMLNSGPESDDVRREAAWALGNIGSKNAIPALTAVLGSKDPYLVENSRIAIAKIERLKKSQ